jgi:pimeloyl-ACP methyl ester carboxylesterase
VIEQIYFIIFNFQIKFYCSIAKLVILKFSMTNTQATFRPDLYYQRVGKGKQTLVLLHGFLGSQQIWKDYVDTLASTYTVIMIDLPGHGHSAVWGACTTMEEMAEGVWNILSAEKLGAVHLCGHSMGGYVSLALAAKYPELVKSITLLNSTARSDSEQKKKDRVLAARIFDMNPELFVVEAIQNLFYTPNLITFPIEVERLKNIALNTAPKGAQASLLGMRERSDKVEWLKETQMPVHYIAGKQDNTVLFEGILEQMDGLNVRLTAFDNCGHMAFVEKKEETLQAMLGFWL